MAARGAISGENGKGGGIGKSAAAVNGRMKRANTALATDNRARPIGVFDSGIGGLTVLKALVEMLPGDIFVISTPGGGGYGRPLDKGSA